jgi:hypothetical protein|tara:strand:- start:1485 stop:2306 length:822 start_codon:yes stop_codon:yes gene_type:complete
MYPNLGVIDFLLETRLEPLFYLPYRMFGPFEPLSLLFLNSFMATILYLIAICVLADKFRTSVTIALIIAVTFFPFEIVSNTPRQLAAASLMFTLLGTRFGLVSLLMHKAAVLPYLLTTGRSAAWLILSAVLVFLLYMSGFLEYYFFSRVTYFFIQAPSFSYLLIAMLIVSLFVLIIDKKNKQFWFAIFAYTILCVYMSKFGPLGVRLSYLIYPLFIVQLTMTVWYLHKILSKKMILVFTYMGGLTMFLYRIGGTGPHEPFTGIPFIEALFWGI